MKQPAAVCLLSATLGCGDGGQIQPESVDALREPAEALRERAEQGDALAQVNLGHMYRTGQGVPQDDIEAMRWYRLAADQGGTGKAYQAGDIKGSANPPGGQN